MPLGQTPEQEITVCDLIEIQRILACSKNPFERLVGALLVAGMLDVRLAQLTDRQIGRLMFDHFRNYLGILLPDSGAGGAFAVLLKMRLTTGAVSLLVVGFV